MTGKILAPNGDRLSAYVIEAGDVNSIVGTGYFGSETSAEIVVPFNGQMATQNFQVIFEGAINISDGYDVWEITNVKSCRLIGNSLFFSITGTGYTKYRPCGLRMVAGSKITLYVKLKEDVSL